MSEQIEEIFEKFKNIFSSRQEEIKTFLKKHYGHLFKNQIIENVEKIDATERIEKAGFHPELSSWKNIYGNIIVSSCEIINGKKVRYDYKFSFVEEKLSEEKIEIVENALNEVKNLESKLLFDDAIAKVDEIIEFIRLDDDKVFNKRLNDRRREIISAKQDFEDSMGKIRLLEEKLEEQKEANDLNAAIITCEKIFEISRSIKNVELIKKFRDKLEKFKKKQAALEEIETLETKLKEYQKQGNLEGALEKCDEILKIIQRSREPSLLKKFSDIKRDLEKTLDLLKQEREKTLSTISELEKEVESFQAEGNFEMIINHCEKIIFLSNQINEPAIAEKHVKIREKTEEKVKILAKIKDLAKELEELRASKNFNDALKISDQILESCKKIERDDLIKKYLNVKENIQEKIKDLEESRENLLQEINKNEKELENKRNIKDFKGALNTCDKLINLTLKLEDEGLKNKYEMIKKAILEEKAELEAKKEKEKKEQQLLLEKARELKDVIPFEEEDVLPLIEEFSINEILKGIPDDPDLLLEEINTLLDSHRVEIKEELKNKTLLRSSSGELLELNKEMKIKPPEKESKKSIHEVASGFENPFDEYLEEAIISDIIPFNYEIEKIELNGEEVKNMVEKSLKKEGLELNWQFTNVPPKEKMVINYDLRRRVSRTIIFMLKDQLKIIKTHSRLKQLGFEGLYEAELPFTNNFGELEGVVVEDIIPLYYLHVIQKPKDELPAETIVADMGDIIKWNIGTMKNETKIYNYMLIELYLFEETKIQYDQLNRKALDALEQENFEESFEKFKAIKDLLEKFT
ncbi:MAG: hypothetical protein ACTSU4_01490 [Promethearchaeota archaeon]